LWNGQSLDLALYSMVVHVLEFFVDGGMPLGTLFWIFVVVGFLEHCGLDHVVLKCILKVQLL